MSGTAFKLFLLGLVSLQTCTCRVVVQVYITRYVAFFQCAGNCVSELTFSLQPTSDANETYPFGRKTFNVSGQNEVFEQNGTIGTSNSVDVQNPVTLNANTVNLYLSLALKNVVSNVIMNFFAQIKEEDVGATSPIVVPATRRVPIELQYSVQCEQMYYGSDCTRYCEDTDDETGHFTCDGGGNPVCLPGYNHSSVKDNRCTQCIENCTTMTSVTTIIAPTRATISPNSPAQAVSVTGIAVGVSVAALVVLAVCVGGVICGVLLIVYQPWNDNLKVGAARTQSTSKSLNNPLYGDNSLLRTFSRRIKRDQNAAANTTSTRSTENSLRYTDRGLDDSNPLYAFQESGKSNPTKIEGASVSLDMEYENFSHTSAKVIPNNVGGVSSIDPYGSVPDESALQSTAAAGVAIDVNLPPQNSPKFDDSTYEIINAHPNYN